MYRKFFKRFFDILFSAFLLLVTSPLLLILIAAIRCTSKGSAIFKQDRIGKDGRIFKMYKLRSMKVGSEHTGSGVYSGKNDDRVTDVGRFIRATSLDELPQLLNILKGDMSFIGPRPPLTYHPWEFDKYTEEQKRMFEVRPGLTGWAQINGRKCVEWNERIRLNIWYIDHLSFLLDLKIILITGYKVFANADNANTKKTVVETETVTELQNHLYK